MSHVVDVESRVQQFSLHAVVSTSMKVGDPRTQNFKKNDFPLPDVEKSPGPNACMLELFFFRVGDGHLSLLL